MVEIFILREVYSSVFGQLNPGDIIRVNETIAQRYINNKYAKLIDDDYEKHYNMPIEDNWATKNKIHCA